MSKEKDKAARRIQSFWRISKAKKEGIYPDYLKVKTDGGFYHRLLKIKSLTPENLLNNESDNLIKEALNYCVTTENKHGLRMIAYTLFSDKKTMLIYNEETRPIIYLLYCVFSDSKSSARDIAFVLLDLFTSGKQIMASSNRFPVVQEELPKGRHGVIGTMSME